MKKLPKPAGRVNSWPMGVVMFVSLYLIGPSYLAFAQNIETKRRSADNRRVFSEQALIVNLKKFHQTFQNGIQEAKKINSEDERIAHRASQASSLSNLAWCIVAAGEYSVGSKDLQNELFSISSGIGWMRVPYGISFREQWEDIPKSFAFVDAGKESPEAVDPRGPMLVWLVSGAIDRITKRTGYKFENYTGPIYLGD